MISENAATTPDSVPATAGSGAGVPPASDVARASLPVGVASPCAAGVPPATWHGHPVHEVTRASSPCALSVPSAALPWSPDDPALRYIDANPLLPRLRARLRTTPGAFGALSSLPFVLLMLFGFVVPLLCVVWFGLMPSRTFSLLQWPTLENYRTIFGQTYYKSILWSVGLATLTVAILLAICYPLAFALAKVFRGGATFITYAIASSLFVSENVRLFGWVIGFMKNGVVGGTLGRFGIQMDSLLYNVPVIVLGMVYVYLPFMLFPLALGVKMVPDQVREAAFDLGASRWQVFRKIDLPLSMPGILIGSLLVFVLSVGAITEAKILGGQKVVTIAADIETEFTYGQNWPLGSALSTLLIALTTVLVFFALGRFDLEKLLGKKRDS
ncbi:ABC-type spermidine/putrescine transport system, permease component I [Opitutaceae bacterium TAV1]|nr:ABC-type spermidine/putrescine transport system, permease component I [Opitutaceae bacterium TAV1]